MEIRPRDYISDPQIVISKVSEYHFYDTKISVFVDIVMAFVLLYGISSLIPIIFDFL